MGNIEVIAVGVRVLAIALLVYIVRYIPTIAAGFESGSPDWINYYSLGFVVSILLVSAILWMFPKTITKKIIPKDIKVDDLKVGKDSMLSLGFIMLGMYFLFYTIGDLIFWGYVLIGSGLLSMDQKVNILVTFIELGICLVLIFGSRGLSNIILKLRGR